MKNLLSRDSFFAAEVDIFKAVCRWIQANGDVSQENQSEILNTVRLPLMNIKELLEVVRPTGLISPDTILDAIEMQTLRNPNNKINYRGLLRKFECQIFRYCRCLHTGEIFIEINAVQNWNKIWPLQNRAQLYYKVK